MAAPHLRVNPTLVLLVVAALLGLYVWRFELGGEERREQAAAAERRLVAFEADDVTELWLPLEDDAQARLVREPGGEWRLAEPLDFAAEQRTVERALDALIGLESTARIEEPPEDLTPYGLGPGEGERVSASTGAGESVALRLGGDAPVGGLRYVWLGDEGPIVTVDSADAAALSHELINLRDRRVALAGIDQVTGFSLEVEGALVARAAREAGEWKILEPVAARADESRVRRLIQDAVLARALEFVDRPSSLAPYGLDRPEVAVGLALEDGGSSRIELARVDGTVYARGDTEDVVYAVPERVLDGMPRSFFDLRYKRLVSVAPSTVERIELGFPRDEQQFAFEKLEGRWMPLDPQLELEPLVVADLLYALEGLDASGLEPADADPLALGLEPARVRVTLTGAGRELGWLELGDPRPNAELPARSSESPRLWRVPGDLGEEVPLSVEKFWEGFARELAAEPNAPD